MLAGAGGVPAPARERGGVGLVDEAGRVVIAHPRSAHAFAYLPAASPEWRCREEAAQAPVRSTKSGTGATATATASA